MYIKGIILNKYIFYWLQQVIGKLNIINVSNFLVYKISEFWHIFSYNYYT